MLTLLHASDFHFGPPYVPVVGEALLRAATELGPDVIVASGDFTQRAKAEQFAAARAWLDRLPKVPIIVVPGNHDIPLYRVYERLFTPYALYERYISKELNSVLVRDDAVFVALNTTAPLRAITRGRIAPGSSTTASAPFATRGRAWRGSSWPISISPRRPTMPTSAMPCAAAARRWTASAPWASI